MFLARSFQVPVELVQKMWWCLTDHSSHQYSRLPVLPVRRQVAVLLVNWRGRNAKKRAVTIIGSGHPADEPVSDSERFSDHASTSIDEEGEVSDLESAGPDHEELVDVDQELSAEQTYRETICCVRAFMGWSQVPKFDSASSSLDDNPFATSRTPHTSKFYCVNTPYLVDRCISPMRRRSRQTLEKNVMSWALAGTSSALFIRMVACCPQLICCACACMRTSSFCLARR